MTNGTFTKSSQALPVLPVLFLGHGSPMNALTQNEYTDAWRRLGAEIKPHVRAVLILSAHWATRDGLAVTTAARPGVLYDFYGFPDALYRVQYDAPGQPELARHIQERFERAGGPSVVADPTRQLDHGAWSILVHLFPEADVPCVQLSYDMTAPARAQLEQGRILADDLTGAPGVDSGFSFESLRKQGVLILASGNLVHNLRAIHFSADAPPFDWAIEFDEFVKNKLGAGGAANFETLLDPNALGQAARLSVPGLDHYIPFLNFLGAVHADDRFDYPCEGIQNGSISMRSIRAARPVVQ